MRALVPVCVLLSVAAIQSALSASLEGVEKEEKVVYNDGLSELKKVDQMEFEAAQKKEQMNDQTQFEAPNKEDAVHVNVTVGDNEDTRYLEAHKDECEEQRREPAHVNTGGEGSPEAAATADRDETKSSEETEEHDRDSVSSSEEATQDTRSKME